MHAAIIVRLFVELFVKGWAQWNMPWTELVANADAFMQKDGQLNAIPRINLFANLTLGYRYSQL